MAVSPFCYWEELSCEPPSCGGLSCEPPCDEPSPIVETSFGEGAAVGGDGARVGSGALVGGCGFAGFSVGFAGFGVAAPG